MCYTRDSLPSLRRLASLGYEGHSLRMIRRVAKALRARVSVVLEPDLSGKADGPAEGAPIALAYHRFDKWPSHRMSVPGKGPDVCSANHAENREAI